jgi:thioredoxin reductase (NADPH)
LYDLIIIGAGFAGYSAAIYSVRYSMKTLIIASELGGIVTEAHKVENYPGYRSISGLELMQKFEQHARDLGAEIMVDEVVAIIKEGDIFKLHTQNLKIYEAKTVIIASGTKKKKLGIPGQDNFDAKGVHYCATCDAPFYRNKTVAVIGGGNSALTAADLLMRYAQKVYIIYRGTELKAEPAVADPVLNNPKVEVIFGTNLLEYKGGQFLESVTLDKQYNGSSELKLDGVFVEIGGIPSSALTSKLGIKIGSTGEIIVNQSGETGIPGLYAAGDVTNTILRQGVVAASSGAIAATMAYRYWSGKSAGSTWN